MKKVMDEDYSIFNINNKKVVRYTNSHPYVECSKSLPIFEAFNRYVEKNFGNHYFINVVQHNNNIIKAQWIKIIGSVARYDNVITFSKRSLQKFNRMYHNGEIK